MQLREQVMQVERLLTQIGREKIEITQQRADLQKKSLKQAERAKTVESSFKTVRAELEKAIDLLKKSEAGRIQLQSELERLRTIEPLSHLIQLKKNEIQQLTGSALVEARRELAGLEQVWNEVKGKA